MDSLVSDCCSKVHVVPGGALPCHRLHCEDRCWYRKPLTTATTQRSSSTCSIPDENESDDCFVDIDSRPNSGECSSCSSVADESIESASTSAYGTGSNSARSPEQLSDVEFSSGPELTETLPQTKVNSVEPVDIGLPFFKSQFPFVGPTIRFPYLNERAEPLPENLRDILIWKSTKTTPIVIKRAIQRTGLKFSKKRNQWIGTWGQHMRAFQFKFLKDYQKINHFPGTFQIGRKDRLWKNIVRLRALHGKREFSFVPMTFVLPHDLRSLRREWELAGPSQRWILKPPAAARGMGIRVLHKFDQLPKKGAVVVQKYLSKPYLINGTKFDLRLYVYISSFDPLRIYLYRDGLVRFASVKYNNSIRCLSDHYMHLTNFSVNKHSLGYIPNHDELACQGHKWSLVAFWKFLEDQQIDVRSIQEQITDLILKTVISCETSVNILSRANLSSRYSCHELLGFDIMLDNSLKPWLIEVNISPSLHSSSPLDVRVKGSMVCDMLNIAGFRIPAGVSSQAKRLLANRLEMDQLSLCLDRRWFTVDCLTEEDKTKQKMFVACTEREEYLERILENLTPDDIRQLILSEDELSRSGKYQRIFPTAQTFGYFQYFDQARYYLYLMDAWETRYSHNRPSGISMLSEHCRNQVHLTFAEKRTNPAPKTPEKESSSMDELDFVVDGDLARQMYRTASLTVDRSARRYNHILQQRNILKPNHGAQWLKLQRRQKANRTLLS